MLASGNNVSEESVSAKINDDWYSSGIFNPYSSSTYPSVSIIGSPELRVSVSLNEYASIHPLSFKYWIFHLDGVVLFVVPNNGSAIGVDDVVKGPRSTSPTFVCIFTTIRFVGTFSL